MDNFIYPNDSDRTICEKKGILNDLIKLASRLKLRHGILDAKIAKGYRFSSGFELKRGQPCTILHGDALEDLKSFTSNRFNVSLGENLLIWYDDNVLTIPTEYVSKNSKPAQLGLF